MAETFQEQLSRVALMASGDPTWDLSDNDLAALTAVVNVLTVLGYDEHTSACSHQGRWFCPSFCQEAGRGAAEKPHWRSLDMIQDGPPHPEARSSPEREQCQHCGGAGEEIIGEHRVTRDMAIDAGDRSMEGAFHSYAMGPCDACGGSGVIDAPLDDLAALRAQVRALIEENERLKEALAAMTSSCDVQQIGIQELKQRLREVEAVRDADRAAGARMRNDLIMERNTAESRLATLAAVVREVVQEIDEVAHEPGCPAIADDESDYEHLADAGECACIAATVTRWRDKFRAALQKES